MGYQPVLVNNKIVWRAVTQDLGSVRVDKWHTSKGNVGGQSLGQVQAERPVSGKGYVPSIGREGGHHVLSTKKRKKR